MPVTRILSPRGSETERCDRRSSRWEPFSSARNKTKKRHIIFFNINPWQTDITNFNFSTYLQDCRNRSSSIPNPKIDSNSRKEAHTSWTKNMKYLICYQTSLLKENRGRKDRNKSPVEEPILNRRNLLHHRLHSRIRWDPNLVKKSTTKEEHDKLWKTNNVIKVWRAHTFVGERRGRSPAVKTTPSTPSLPIETTNSPRTRSERTETSAKQCDRRFATHRLVGRNERPMRERRSRLLSMWRPTRPDPTRPNQRFFFLNTWNFAQIRKLKF
jgi:hypothetical protein